MSKPVFFLRIDDLKSKHTRVTVFNRGANAGTLVINTDDLPFLFETFEANVREWCRASGVSVEYVVGDSESGE